jgi:hypothetical protein
VPPLVFVLMRELFGQALRENASPGEDFPLGFFTVLILVVSVLILSGSYFMRGALLSGKFKVIQDRAEKAALASKLPVYVAKYIHLTSIVMAIANSPAVFAFLLFLFGADAVVFYVLISLSVLGTFLYRPTMEELLEMRERSLGT